MNRTVWVLWVCVGMLCAAPAVRAAEGEKAAPPVVAAEAVKVSLTSPAVAGTLKDALDQVAKLGKVRIVVDWESIHDTGVKDDVRVAVKAPKATVGQLLELVLTQAAAKGHPLAYYTEDDAVIVTTQRRVLLRNRVPAPAARAGETRASARPGAFPKINFEALEAKDVFRFLQEISGANMHVNWKALEASGITRQTEVTLQVRNVTMERLLDLVTDEISQTRDKYARVYWVVDQGVVEISTGQALDTTLRTRTFDVADLLMVAPDFKGPRMDLNKAAVGTDNQNNNTSGGLFDTTNNTNNKSSDPEGTETTAELRNRARDNLIGIIKQSIGEDMWQPQGKGAIILHGKQLVISQTLLGWKLMERSLGGR
ncbi:MAG TPA: hypothetical protein DCX07_01960 [Phycisphaerales bacterium]|nr:hypothetical protein [Phycisphaerales bacterium]